jgi:hypothetical protein
MFWKDSRTYGLNMAISKKNFQKIFCKICVAYFFHQVPKLFPQKRSVTCVFLFKKSPMFAYSKKKLKKLHKQVKIILVAVRKNTNLEFFCYLFFYNENQV